MNLMLSLVTCPTHIEDGQIMLARRMGVITVLDLGLMDS